jgi:hypothetical protein
MNILSVRMSGAPVTKTGKEMTSHQQQWAACLTDMSCVY